MDLAAAAVMEHTRNTAKAYESDLRCWMASCIRLGGCPVHTSRHEVQRYLQHLQDLGLAATTRARRLCALS